MSSGWWSRSAAWPTLRSSGRRVLVDPWVRDWDDPLDPDRIGYLSSEHDGGFAELMALDHRQVHPIDSPLDSTALATFPTAHVTAENMLDRAAVAQGDSVLVPGGSGGVGSALIQLARRRGARTVALCSEGKAEAVRKLGPRCNSSPRAELLALGARGSDRRIPRDGGRGHRGRGAVAAAHRGARPLADGTCAQARSQVRSSRSTCARSTCATSPWSARRWCLPAPSPRLVGYIERGEIEPVLAGVWPLSELAAAQTAFIEKRHVGNLVVRVPE